MSCAHRRKAAPFTKKRNRRVGAHPQEGFALPMALVVIIVGLVLSGLIFDIGYSFLSTALNQERFYVDHVSVVDYVEAAKGWLIRHNTDNGYVRHALLRPGPGMPVRSLSDLMLDDPPDTLSDHRYLSFDREVPSQRSGVKRVTVNVFDVHYFKENLADDLLNDAAQMRLLPPPINTVGGIAGSVERVVEIGDCTDSTKGPADKEDDHYRWDKYGAYVVRVQLYDVDKSGNRVLKRVVDEAFYQVLNPGEE